MTKYFGVNRFSEKELTDNLHLRDQAGPYAYGNDRLEIRRELYAVGQETLSAFLANQCPA